MDELIQQLKLRKEMEERAEERRRRASEAFRAFAPEIWETILESVRRSLASLRETFPEDADLRAQMIRQPDCYLLQNEKYPIRILRLELNLAGECIMVYSAVQSELFADVRFVANGRITVDAPGADVPHFHWNGEQFAGYPKLAEKLIRRVCGINQGGERGNRISQP